MIQVVKSSPQKNKKHFVLFYDTYYTELFIL